MKRDPGSNEEDFAAWLADNANITRRADDDENDPYAEYASKYDDDDESEDTSGRPSK